MVAPPATALPPVVGAGGSKPAVAAEVKPTVVARAPKTNYDVDIYDPKAGDTYESIRQEWYNNKQLAAALRAYNRTQDLRSGQYVNIPPKHILQRQFSAPTRGNSGLRISPPATDGTNWSAPSAQPTGTSGRTSYIVPRNGMTLRQIARETLGSEQRWGDLWDLNPQVTPNELAAGTSLKLPADARNP